MDFKGLLRSGSRSYSFDDRELSIRIHLAVDAKLSLHRHRAAPRRIFRRLASRRSSNRIPSSRQTGRTPTEVIRVPTETKRAKLSTGDLTLISAYRSPSFKTDGQM